MDEMLKISAFSSPSIKAPPAPGGLAGRLSSTPATPVAPRQVAAKALKSTSLQQTNYTSVGTKPPTPNFSLTSGQKSQPPPVVR